MYFDVIILTTLDMHASSESVSSVHFFCYAYSNIFFNYKLINAVFACCIKSLLQDWQRLFFMMKMNRVIVWLCISKNNIEIWNELAERKWDKKLKTVHNQKLEKWNNYSHLILLLNEISELLKVNQKSWNVLINICVFFFVITINELMSQKIQDWKRAMK